MRTDFNPQGPRGPRRVSKNVTLFAYCISIHKALAGLDTAFPGGRWHRLYFNPQGPRGPRRCTATRLSLGARFQSTRPSRASTCGAVFFIPIFRFQSTRPSRASTSGNLLHFSILCNFNPQGPRGPRLCSRYTDRLSIRFQSTRPSRASTGRSLAL